MGTLGKIRATVYMVVIQKYYAYLGSDISQNLGFFPIWPRLGSDFLTFFYLSRLPYCLSKGPALGSPIAKLNSNFNFN